MSDDIATLEQKIVAAQRLLAVKTARTKMLPFMRLTMPSPEAPADPNLSRFVETPQARLLCQIIEQMEKGKMQRVAVSIGPQHGKSQILSRGAPAWISGRDPYANIMLGSYNQTFAEEFGGDVREIMTSQMFKLVFPKHSLRKGGTAKDYLVTEVGGKLSFVGVGGSGTGKPADYFFVDDPIRNDEDAQSAVYREKLWKWFTSVVFSRLLNTSRVLVVHCLTGDTKVEMADRTIRRIDEILPGDEVAAWEDGRIVRKKVVNSGPQGVDDLIEVRTGSSRVRANGRHPFLVLKNGETNWVRADDLKKGDLLVTRGRSDDGERRISPEQAWFLGFMFGDGWVTTRCSTNIRKSNGRPYNRTATVTCAAFSKHEDENALVEKAFFDLFGVKPKRTKFGYWRTEVQAVGRWLKAHGLIGGAKDKRIPDWVFAQDIDVRRAFVEGFHHADGTEDEKRQKNCAAANEPLINGLRHLGRTCGIAVSNLHVWSAMIQPPHSKEPVHSTITSFKWGVNEVDSEFHVKPITSLKPAGREEVYDIQVEGSENFIADGLVVHNTRWHQDDLIGRLCDPDHPERNKSLEGIADDWTYINLPAVVEDPKLAEALGLTLEVPTDAKVIKAFGTKPKSALWPERKSLGFLAEAKKMDARVFGALYMGQPTPEDGDYFKKDDIVEYDPIDLPKNLRKYGASDHAVTEKQKNDATCLGCVGVDEDDNIWVLPDLVWDRFKTDRTVDEMILQMKTHKPMMWWMESELISKSFGPFLQKRMQEEKVYTYLDPVTVSKTDKIMRARSIQGRMQHRKVRFPRTAPWYAAARAEMLKFPYGAHDDFVDFIAHIGRGLLKEVKASTVSEKASNVAPTGSIQWILQNAKSRAENEKRYATRKGW